MTIFLLALNNLHGKAHSTLANDSLAPSVSEHLSPALAVAHMSPYQSAQFDRISAHTFQDSPEKRWWVAPWGQLTRGSSLTLSGPQRLAALIFAFLLLGGLIPERARDRMREGGGEHESPPDCEAGDSMKSSSGQTPLAKAPATQIKRSMSSYGSLSDGKDGSTKQGLIPKLQIKRSTSSYGSLGELSEHGIRKALSERCLQTGLHKDSVKLGW